MKNTHFTQHVVTTKDVPASKSLLGLHIFVIVLLLATAGVVAKPFIPESVTQKLNNDYTWQKTCDARCAEIIGKADMAAIDAYGCSELMFARELMREMIPREIPKMFSVPSLFEPNEMIQIQNPMYQEGAQPPEDIWHTTENLAALNDRIAHTRCE